MPDSRDRLRIASGIHDTSFVVICSTQLDSNRPATQFMVAFGIRGAGLSADLDRFRNA
jgi:hypothetical protein